MDFDEVSANTIKTGDNQQPEDLLFLDENSEQQFSATKECIIFLIDCHSSMHSLFEENTKTTPLSAILKVTENFLKTKIISNEKDLFGMVLYNTSITDNDMGFSGVNILFKIGAPDAMMIKKLKVMCQNCDPETNINNFQNELKNIFPASQDENKNNLNDALWTVHNLLKNYDKKSYKRRIFLFTDNDDPMKNETQQEKNICIQRAKDMSESDIIIEIFPMNFNGKKFNLSTFYAQIIPANSEEDIDGGNDNILTIEQCNDRLRELTKRIRQKEIKKRTLGKVPFYLTNNTKIYMNIYSANKKAYKGKIYNVDAKTNKLLKGVNSMICKDSGAELYPEQVGTYQLYGNKKIIFTKEEMKKIKFLEEPGMKLLGFKSIDKIKPYYNIRESYFIYPNELFSNGAGKLVDALIKQMSVKKKCAIVKLVSRESSVMKICALLPQQEKFDEDYFQTPPGFNMIILPWADDIRSNSEILSKNPEKMPNVSNEQSELAKSLIKRMNISFDCRAFENVELQKFYATLQALALEESNIEKIEDTLQPANEGLEKVLKGVDEEFREKIFGNEGGRTDELVEKYAKGSRINNKSRSRSRSKDSQSSRKSKSKDSQKSNKSKKGRKKNVNDSDDELDIDDEKFINKIQKRKIIKEVEEKSDEDEQGAGYSDEVLKKLLENKKLEKMNVTELKDICKIRKIGTKGLKKADILEKLKSYLDKDY